MLHYRLFSLSHRNALFFQILAHADDIVILSRSYSEMQGLLVAVNRHATAVGMHFNASKTTMMSALIPGVQHQAVLLDGEPWMTTERGQRDW